MSEITSEKPSLFDVEMQLEEQMAARGVARLVNAAQNHKEHQTEYCTVAGKELIGHKIHVLAKAIDAWKEATLSGEASNRAIAIKLIKDVDSGKLAFLALRQIVAGISSDTPLSRVALAIGRAIEDEINLSEFRMQERDEYKKMLVGAKKRTSDHNRRYYALKIVNDYIEMDKWTDTERLHVGMKLIDLCIGSVGIVQIINVQCGRKTVKKVTALPEVLQWMKDRTDFLGELRPVYEPMVTRPKQWTNPYDGGYLSSNIKPLRLVKRGPKAYFDALAKADMPIVYAAVNAIQNTAWQINTWVLEVMQTFWDNGVQAGELPLKDGLPLPEKPYDIETNPESQLWYRRQANEVHLINTANRSKRAHFEIMLDIARRYSKYKKFYQPHQLDFRGRVYAVSPLSCQGSDTTKALLRFASGKPLGPEGWKWLAVHGAGLIGNDKVSFEDRVNFILDNEEVILAIAENPYDNRQWFGEIGGYEVDKPWQFLAWCKDWAGFVKYGEAFVSKIPIAMDGSCSGLQHYSAMLKDEKVGAAVNLLPSDKPSDVYALVAGEVLKSVNDDMQNGTEDELKLVNDEPKFLEGTKTFAKQWLEFGINRKVTKRAVMTLCYGSKQYGFAEQLMEDFIHKARMNEEKLPFTGDGKKACNYLAKKIWDAVKVSITKASEAMEWLQQVARIASKKEMPVHWTTALGFPVWHEYAKMEVERVATSIYGESRVWLSLEQPTRKLDPRKQASALAPNFIHSCDATHMMLATVRAQQAGIESFAMIHDSFGCPAGDAQTMYSVVREAMVEIYGNLNPLEMLKEDMEELLGEELPALPECGDLDIRKVQDSPFCFS